MMVALTSADLIEAVSAQAPFPVRYIPLPANMGKPTATNGTAALGAVTGDLIAYLDDDDVWLPDHLLAAVDVLSLAPPASTRYVR